MVAERLCRHQLADTGWQPSKLELEAALGASREQVRELQWRLQRAEEALRQQVRGQPVLWWVENAGALLPGAGGGCIGGTG